MALLPSFPGNLPITTVLIHTHTIVERFLRFIFVHALEYYHCNTMRLCKYWRYYGGALPLVPYDCVFQCLLTALLYMPSVKYTHTHTQLHTYTHTATHTHTHTCKNIIITILNFFSHSPLCFCCIDTPFPATPPHIHTHSMTSNKSMPESHPWKNKEIYQYH